MDEHDLKAIEERLEKATPGPWHAGKQDPVRCGMRDALLIIAIVARDMTAGFAVFCSLGVIFCFFDNNPAATRNAFIIGVFSVYAAWWCDKIVGELRK